jgi:hypothetical protein
MEVVWRALLYKSSAAEGRKLQARAALLGLAADARAARAPEPEGRRQRQRTPASHVLQGEARLKQEQRELEKCGLDLLKAIDACGTEDGKPAQAVDIVSSGQLGWVAPPEKEAPPPPPVRAHRRVWPHPLRDKSDCHCRKTATEYYRNPGVKWWSCTAN